MKHKVSLIAAIIVMFATLALSLAGCAPFAERPSAEVIVKLPPIGESIRAIPESEIARLQTATAKYRVTANSFSHIGTGGTFYFVFAAGTKVSVTVECINSQGQVIVRTDTKSLVVTRGGDNSMTFVLSKDGTEIVHEAQTEPTPSPEPTLQPQPEPEPAPGENDTPSDTDTEETENFTVTYELNGDGWSDSTNLPQPTTAYAVGEPVAITANVPIKQGFAFMGWKPSVESLAPAGGNLQANDTFTMPAADVTLAARWLWMSDHEVTQKEWDYVMTQDPSSRKIKDDFGKGDDYPMYYVLWYDALVYCNKLSKQEGLTECYTINGKTNPDEWGPVPTSSDDVWNAVICDFNADGYRLPTEAEWEYMAKGGENYTYSGSDTIADVAWNKNNSNAKAHEVKQMQKNGYEMYDMSGNVWEWCWDWYTPDTERVKRGGSWNYDVECAVSYRYKGELSENSAGNGFRVVRSQ